VSPGGNVAYVAFARDAELPAVLRCRRRVSFARFVFPTIQLGRRTQLGSGGHPLFTDSRNLWH